MIEATASSASSPWDQIAVSKPFLLAHIDIVEHRYRNDTWYVINNRLAATFYRCDRFSKDFLSRLDGEVNVGEAFALASFSYDGQAPHSDEIIRLLAALREAEMLGGLPDANTGDAKAVKTTSPWLQAIIRPLAVKIPLLDPHKALTWLLPRVKHVFTAPVLGFSCALILWASLLAMSRWPELVVHFESRFLDWGNVLLLWLSYPLLKGAHEIGHGLVARRFGGEVHEMGIMFLVFMPVPYVDASSSSAFASKYQRMAVALAGIGVELFLSSIALIAWVALEPGLLRDAAFNIAFIGGVSTLLFNGNPLLRFDGYYALCDAIEAPNLGTRSNQYLGYIFKHYALGMSRVKSSVSSRGERRWFISYGIAAFCYRIFISTTIALYIASKFFVFGIALAIWMLFLQFVLPVIKGSQKLWPDLVAEGKQRRMQLVSLGVMLCFYLGFFAVPLPHATQVAAVVELGDRAQVRSAAEGFIRKVSVRDGELVKQGDLLLELEDPSLAARLQLAQARLDELKAKHHSLLVSDLNAASQVVDEIHSARAEHDDLLQQSRGLQVRATQDGIVALASLEDLPGRFVKQGRVLAHVVDLSSVRLRTAVEQNDVDDVRRRTRRVDIRFHGMPYHTYVGDTVTEVPMATNELPSALLGSKFGGRIAVDARDENGLRAIKEIFQFDVSLPHLADGEYIGKSAQLRFVHTEQPIGVRLWHHLRYLLSKELAA